MSCAFCSREVKGARCMVAWWETGKRVTRAGVYCRGRDRCLDAAEAIPGLRDVHAEDIMAANTVPFLLQVRRDYRWSPRAWAQLVDCVLDLQESA